MRVGYTSMGACIFAKLGAEALDSLPAWVLEQMGNVEDLAPPGQPNLLGPYEGVPLSATGEMEPKAAMCRGEFACATNLSDLATRLGNPWVFASRAPVRAPTRGVTL